MITIGCVWDGGDYYPLEYVNKLCRMVKRNTTLPFFFLLYAGPLAQIPGRLAGLEPGILVEFSGLPYWWGGMRYWKKKPPGVHTDRLLYLDLDIVIVGSLDEIICYPSDHACMKDYPAEICPKGQEREVNVSVTVMDTGARPDVWDVYVAAGMPTWNTTRDRGPLPLGAQTIINGGVRTDLLPENWVCSYKLHQVHKRGLPPDCRVVVFHGRPKPHEVDDEFVKEHWR